MRRQNDPAKSAWAAAALRPPALLLPEIRFPGTAESEDRLPAGIPNPPAVRDFPSPARVCPPHAPRTSASVRPPEISDSNMQVPAHF